MPFINNNQILLKRFEIWTSRYIIIKIAIRDYVISLAEIGYIISNHPPVINTNDPSFVCDIKKKIVTLYSEQQSILKNIKVSGGHLLNMDTLEILLEGGPEKGSFLSWMPGEEFFSYWRKSKNNNDDRLYLQKTVKNNEHRFIN